MTQILAALVILTTVGSQTSALSSDEIASAIALGKQQKVPIVRVTSFLGDFDVEILGPMARVALAAALATKEFKPFEATNVTPQMSARTFLIQIRRRSDGRATTAKRIVVQPKGAKGMDGVVQPIHEDLWKASFDQLPDGEFQVVVVTEDRPQKYTVTEKDHRKIQ